MRAHAGPCGPMRAHASPCQAHASPCAMRDAGPCRPMRAHASPCQAHAKPMPSPCQAHAGRTWEVAKWRRRARVAACAWFLDRNLLTPLLGAGRHLLLCCCPAAAALLLPCSFNGVEGVQGSPAPPLLLAPLLLPSFLLAPLLLPPLLLPPLLLSPLALPPTPCHNTTISNRRHFFPTTKTTRFRQSHARSTRVFVVAHVTVEAHRSTVINLGGV